MISAGEELFVLKFLPRKKIYEKYGPLKVIQVGPRFITVDHGCYRQSLDVFDLRKKLYKLLKLDGTEIKFKPVQNAMKLERENLTNELSEYRKTTGEACYRSAMKMKGEDEIMRNAKITKEQLITEVKENGTSKEAVGKIAEKYGMSSKDINARISGYKIKTISGIETTVPVKQVVEKQKKEVSAPAIEKVDKPRTRLKPKALVNQDTHFEYELMAEELIILDPGRNGQIFVLPWENIEMFIEELLEIKRVGEESA